MLLVSFFLFFLSNKCFLVANLLEESQPEIFVIETEEDADAKAERVITTYKPQAEDEDSASSYSGGSDYSNDEEYGVAVEGSDYHHLNSGIKKCCCRKRAGKCIMKRKYHKCCLKVQVPAKWVSLRDACPALKPDCKKTEEPGPDPRGKKAS